VLAAYIVGVWPLPYGALYYMQEELLRLGFDAWEAAKRRGQRYTIEGSTVLWRRNWAVAPRGSDIRKQPSLRRFRSYTGWRSKAEKEIWEGYQDRKTDIVIALRRLKQEGYRKVRPVVYYRNGLFEHYVRYEERR